MKNLMKQITKNGRIFWVTYFTFFLILAMPTHAWAYVDPATLTYVVQIIAGVFIAGGVAVGVYWRKIKKLFSKDKTSVKKHESTEQERNAAAAAAEEFNEVSFRERNTNEYQEEYFIESGTVNNDGHGKNGTGCA